MRLADLDLKKLLPVFMQKDGAVIGLCAGSAAVLKELSAAAKLLTTWDKIDYLPESELDSLAWELNILWYDKSADIRVKRDLIKDSDNIHRKLGTKWAVENVISTYFGDGEIKEWFEYEGTPGHFRVYSTNPSLTNERLAEFMDLLGKVKRASAHLDGIFITLTGQMNLTAGIGLHEYGRELFTVAN